MFEITDIVNAAVGQVISLKCGVDGDSGVTIKKNKKFSLLSAAWTPKKGEILRVMKRADCKFIEIERATAPGDSYEFPADETTPSVQGATVFVTNANTQATAITDLTDAVREQSTQSTEPEPTTPRQSPTPVTSYFPPP